MKKRKDYEKTAVALFLIGVIMVCGIVFLRDPRITGYATKEQSISLINKQSYAAVYDKWIIRFKTEGEGDLEVSEIKDVFYEISPLEIKCGNEILNYEHKGRTIIVRGYKCDQIGSITTEIRNEGIQTIKLKFGNKVYASNTAIKKENI